MPININENPLSRNSSRPPRRPEDSPEPYKPADGMAASVNQPGIQADRWFGVFPALVTNNLDPDNTGRIQVRLPWAPNAAGSSGIEKEPDIALWARVATMMAGDNRGSWFIPDVGDEVLICFQAGDPSHPVVIGALWNGVDTPPETMDPGGENNIKTLKTRSGNEISFDDEDGEESITISTSRGEQIRLQDGDGGVISITDSHGNRVLLSGDGIRLDAAAKISVAAPLVQIDSAMLKASGVIECNTLIANSVVAASYTPGAGNIW